LRLALILTGAARRSTVEVADAQRQRMDAALEVGADRRRENAELIFFGGGDTDDWAAAEHKRAYIERSAGAVRRHIRGVSLDGLDDCVDETFFREYGHFEPFGAVFHALAVHIGTKSNDMSILSSVGFKALEARLRILQDTRGLADGDGVVTDKFAVVPCAVAVVRYVALVGLAVTEIKV
jgi:hypothetical protein